MGAAFSAPPKRRKTQNALQRNQQIRNQMRQQAQSLRNAQRVQKFVPNKAYLAAVNQQLKNSQKQCDESWLRGEMVRCRPSWDWNKL